MQKNSSISSRNDGDDGIYNDNESTNKRDINQTDCGDTERISAARAISKSANFDAKAKRLQLDAARRVLEALDVQIDNLDKLQAPIKHLNKQTNYHLNLEVDFAQQLTNQSHQREDHRRALTRAIEARRKLALDYLKGGGGEQETGAGQTQCGCHFEHNDQAVVDLCLCGADSQIDGLQRDHTEPSSLSATCNGNEESASNLFDFIEQISWSSGGEHNNRTQVQAAANEQRAEIEESSYISGELFIEDEALQRVPLREYCAAICTPDEARSFSSELGVVVPQGLVVVGGAAAAAAARQNNGDPAEREREREQESCPTCLSVASAVGRSDCEQNNQIERKYSQHLTGFRLFNCNPQDSSTSPASSSVSSCEGCSQISELGEEETEGFLQEIGNALVARESRSNSRASDEPASAEEEAASSRSICRIGQQQQFTVAGGRWSQSSEHELATADECSLIDDDDDDDNNNDGSYEEANYPSSSSLALSWSQDFLQTLSSLDDQQHQQRRRQQQQQHQLEEEEEEGEALPLIISPSPSCSEGNIDFGRDSYCSGNSILSSQPEYNGSEHELPSKLRKQQQRRHSSGSLKLHEGCRKPAATRYNSLNGADELDFAISANARGSESASRVFIPPASFDEFFHQQTTDKQHFDGGSRPRRRNAPTRQQRARSSMRAARDIAKLSVPSLSALQYLPSQLDQSQAKRRGRCNSCSDSNDSRHSRARRRHFLVGKESHKSRINMASANQTPTKEAARVCKTEETSSHGKHDDSCLFHRLCMCSCAGNRQHHLQQTADGDADAEGRDDNLTLEKGLAQAAASLVRRGSSRSSSRKSGKSNRNESRSLGVSPSPTSDKNDDDDESRCSSGERARKAAAASAGEEKQSPSFLNLLLRPSSPRHRLKVAQLDELSRSTDSESKPLNKRQDSRSSPAKNSKSDADNLRLGSDGDLIQSRASSAQDGAEDLSSADTAAGSGDDGGSSWLLPSRSPSSLSSVASSSIIVRQGEDATICQPPRSKSACSTRRPSEHHEQADSKPSRGHKNYKRFLSPRRLFTHNARDKKLSGLESLVENELKQRGDSPSKQPQDQLGSNKSRSSFLSRSLTRLTSQRAAKAPAAKKSVAEDSAYSQHNTSPSSRSTTPAVDSSCCASALSASSQRLDHGKQLASAAPEIVLNSVEFVGADCSSAPMTRPKGDHQHHLASMRHLDGASSLTTDGSQDNLSLVGGGRAHSLPPPSPGGHFRGGQRRQHGNRSPRLSESPVLFRSPAAMSTKIEDGLKVCSSEHFEKHIDNVKGNQDDFQSKLFKAWINHIHPNLIRRDLVEEFRDGIKLIGLLASLTRDKELRSIYEKLNNDKQSYVNRLVTTPSSRLRHLSNVSIAIDYLRRKRRMKLVNLNPMDIVSGKPNVVLGLCWNIILNFQLEQPASSDDNHSISDHSTTSLCTSRLPSASKLTTNEDGSGQQLNKNESSNSMSSTPIRVPTSKKQSTTTTTTSSLIEEYGTNDLVKAKRRLLERINQRFNLKLTNLTSNLLDGDVLLAIIKRLVPNIKDVDSLITRSVDQDDDTATSGARIRSWNTMSNEEKLDCCFDIAETHLGIPRLFDGSDLGGQQQPQRILLAGVGGARSSLIYLSMLLSAEQSAASQHPVDCNQPEVHNSLAGASSPNPSFEQKQIDKLEDYLDELDVEDRFDIGQLDSTLKKIRTLEKLAETTETSEGDAQRRQTLLNRCQRLQQQASQVEALIGWINEADQLLEGSQQSKSAKDLTDSIGRYREFFSAQNLPRLETSLCPTLERQYRECLSSAKQRVLSMEQTLKNWISYEEARKELRDWLARSEVKLSSALNPVQPDQQDQRSPLALHSDRLEDLIDFFELENVDDQRQPNNNFVVPEQMPLSLMSLNSLESAQLDSVSLSGSLISLGSTSSRMSTLQSSKKASYHKLFDDFELKCRLLAAMLDRDQRDSLLLGVKELRNRLRYITEQKVPQAVNELRMSIGRCEMSIQEHEDEYDQQPTSDQEAELQLTEADDSAILSDSQSSRVSASLNSNRHDELVSSVGQEGRRGETALVAKSPLVESSPLLAPPPPAQNNKKSTNNKGAAKHINRRSPKSRSKSGKKRASSVKSTKSDRRVRPAAEEDEAVELSLARRVWLKLIRAFRTSLPLNIVLLVCLAGLCVVPMLQKDACCGMAQEQLTTSNHLKPV